MPLRLVQESYPETLREMYLAADARFREGRRLIAAEQYDGGIYLLGYTAEMMLKLAFCRLDPNIGLNDPVAAALIRMRSLWRSLFPGTPLDFHDLDSLAFLVEYAYQQSGRQYAPDFQREFAAVMRRLYQNWWVSNRYRYPRAIREEAAATVSDVEWLIKRHSELWR